MSWNTPLRAAIHEAGHVVVGFVATSGVAVPAEVYVEPYYDDIHGDSWRGATDKSPDVLACQTDEDWVQGVAALYSGKEAVAAAYVHGDLQRPPDETDPGSIGYETATLGQHGTDRYRIDEAAKVAAQKTGTPEADIKTRALTMAQGIVAARYDSIVELARLILALQCIPEDGSRRDPTIPLERSCIEDWLREHL